jgi:hypothetical protein
MKLSKHAGAVWRAADPYRGFSLMATRRDAAMALAAIRD